MDRRDVLKYTAYLTGYAVTAPLTSAILSGCKAEPAGPTIIPQFFSPETFPSFTAMVDAMLPKTSTPGAVELGVHGFVDIVLAKYTEAEDQSRLKQKFNDWLATVTEKVGSNYAGLSADDQLRVLNELDSSSKQLLEELETQDLTPEEWEEQAPWWLGLKSTIIGGYYSSEYVGTEVLAYDPVPGAYQGCIPLTDVGKSWSL